MAFKKIKLQNCDCCPGCGGLTGIKFSVKGYALCSNKWGSDPAESKQDRFLVNDQTVKTAMCVDCGKRFEIIG